MLVYISIGSNLSSPAKQTENAINALKNIPKSQIIRISSYYRTLPLGSKNQPDYLNAAVSLNSDLSPKALLDEIQNIELQQGRIRTQERWGPRIIDLDIMLFGNKTIREKFLTIPHYDIKNRSFMLWPLFEIAPKLCFPDGETLKSVLSRLKEKRPSFW